MRPLWFGVLAICLVDAVPTPQYRDPKLEAAAAKALFANPEFGRLSKAEEDRRHAASIRREIDQSVALCMQKYDAPESDLRANVEYELGKQEARNSYLADCAINAKQTAFASHQKWVDPSPQWTPKNFRLAEKNAGRAKLAQGIADIASPIGLAGAIGAGILWAGKKAISGIFNVASPLKASGGAVFPGDAAKLF